jgi:excisionase family DNA binding protein
MRIPVPAGHVRTAEAAERLGVTLHRVRELITEGRLRGQKSGRLLFVDESTLAALERLRNHGGRRWDRRP